MRLRSGLLVGESRGLQANQAVQVPPVTDMQEDDFSTRAEAGTPYPSSLSINGGERSPRSPGFGEAGPSNYRDAQQSLPAPYQGNNHRGDFQPFSSSPTPDVNQFNDDGMFYDRMPATDLPRLPQVGQHQFAPSHHGQPSHDSYFPEQSHLTPTQPTLHPLQTHANQAPPGMIPEWETRAGAWSPVARTAHNIRKRSLVEEHDLSGYAKDRDRQDKMQEELDNLGNFGGTLNSEEEEEKRKRKRPRRSTRTRPSKANRRDHEPRDHEEDRDHRQGQGGQSMRV